MRPSELRANFAAVELLRAKGYDPLALDTIFSKLVYETVGGDGAMPSLDLDAVRNRAESSVPPADGYLLDSSQFAALRERVQSGNNVSRSLGSNVILRRKQ